MNKSQIEKEIIEILRRRALHGSSREISLTTPLGEQGLGLDSLALIEFVTSLENHFQTVIPEEIWTAGSKLTLQHFADLISMAVPAPPTAAEELPPTSRPPVTTPRDEARPAEEPGRPRSRSDWRRKAPFSYLYKLSKFLYERESYMILERDLRGYQVPAPNSPLHLLLRQATREDEDALERFWLSFRYYTLAREEMNRTLFRKRLDSGYTCLTAWLGDEVIGIDWLLTRSYRCPHTGLELAWPPEAIYAGELYEHKQQQGKGVGLALLAFSLAESQKNGYLRQVTLVTAKNIKMLGAAMQLFGFVKTGEIHTTRLFRQPISSWRVRTEAGRGGKLVL